MPKFNSASSDHFENFPKSKIPFKKPAAFIQNVI